MAFDVTDPAHLAALKSEVLTDPAGVGYNPEATTDTIEKLNSDTASETVEKPVVFSKDVKSATTFDAYNGLAIDEQEWLQWMTSGASSDLEDLVVTADIKLKLAGIGGNDSDSIWAVADRTGMIAAMNNLINVPASRAEVLFGYGTFINRDDWFAARDS